MRSNAWPPPAAARGALIVGIDGEDGGGGASAAREAESLAGYLSMRDICAEVPSVMTDVAGGSAAHPPTRANILDALRHLVRPDTPPGGADPPEQRCAIFAFIGASGPSGLHPTDHLEGGAITESDIVAILHSAPIPVVAIIDCIPGCRILAASARYCMPKPAAGAPHHHFAPPGGLPEEAGGAQPAAATLENVLCLTASQGGGGECHSSDTEESFGEPDERGALVSALLTVLRAHGSAAPSLAGLLASLKLHFGGGGGGGGGARTPLLCTGDPMLLSPSLTFTFRFPRHPGGWQPPRAGVVPAAAAQPRPAPAAAALPRLASHEKRGGGGGGGGVPRQQRQAELPVGWEGGGGGGGGVRRGGGAASNTSSAVTAVSSSSGSRSATPSPPPSPSTLQGSDGGAGNDADDDATDDTPHRQPPPAAGRPTRRRTQPGTASASLDALLAEADSPPRGTGHAAAPPYRSFPPPPGGSAAATTTLPSVLPGSAEHAACPQRISPADVVLAPTALQQLRSYSDDEAEGPPASSTAWGAPPRSTAAAVAAAAAAAGRRQFTPVGLEEEEGEGGGSSSGSPTSGGSATHAGVATSPSGSPPEVRRAGGTPPDAKPISDSLQATVPLDARQQGYSAPSIEREVVSMEREAGGFLHHYPQQHIPFEITTDDDMPDPLPQADAPRPTTSSSRPSIASELYPGRVSSVSSVSSAQASSVGGGVRLKGFKRAAASASAPWGGDAGSGGIGSLFPDVALLRREGAGGGAAQPPPPRAQQARGRRAAPGSGARPATASAGRQSRGGRAPTPPPAAPPRTNSSSYMNNTRSSSARNGGGGGGGSRRARSASSSAPPQAARRSTSAASRPGHATSAMRGHSQGRSQSPSLRQQQQQRAWGQRRSLSASSNSSARGEVRDAAGAAAAAGGEARRTPGGRAAPPGALPPHRDTPVGSRGLLSGNKPHSHHPHGGGLSAAAAAAAAAATSAQPEPCSVHPDAVFNSMLPDVLSPLTLLGPSVHAAMHELLSWAEANRSMAPPDGALGALLASREAASNELQVTIIRLINACCGSPPPDILFQGRLADTLLSAVAVPGEAGGQGVQGALGHAPPALRLKRSLLLTGYKDSGKSTALRILLCRLYASQQRQGERCGPPVVPLHPARLQDFFVALNGLQCIPRDHEFTNEGTYFTSLMGAVAAKVLDALFSYRKEFRKWQGAILLFWKRVLTGCPSLPKRFQDTFPVVALQWNKLATLLHSHFSVRAYAKILAVVLTSLPAACGFERMHIAFDGVSPLMDGSAAYCGSLMPALLPLLENDPRAIFFCTAPEKHAVACAKRLPQSGSWVQVSTAGLLEEAHLPKALPRHIRCCGKAYGISVFGGSPGYLASFVNMMQAAGGVPIDTEGGRAGVPEEGGGDGGDGGAEVEFYSPQIAQLLANLATLHSGLQGGGGGGGGGRRHGGGGYEGRA